MMSRRFALVLLTALVATCIGFQVVVPPVVLQRNQQSFQPTSAIFMAEEKTTTEDADTTTTTDDSSSTTDIEVPKFDAKDFAEETSSGPSFDWFSAVLVGYVLFVIADTAFHITPEKPYIQVIMEAIGGGGGEGAEASSSN